MNLSSNRVERRLAAVLAADVAGYSRLMGLDEEGTLARLKAVRKTLVDPTIAAHRGRIVKTTGDGVLVEFASAVDAVRSAIEVQHGMVAQNADVSSNIRIEFRIGIHDIIFDENDIFGDGVNIAARLEGIAEPGGICMSDDAYRQVRGKIEIAFADLGTQTLKNIAELMRAWRAVIGTASPMVRARTTAQTVQPLPLPDKPSIAVLPFQNMSGDPDQEYFADGMVEDIITALSRFKSLFVIARNSSFTYKGGAVDIKQVGRELGVRYVLEGSVRKAGGRIRITGQLIEAATNNHLWADRFEGALEDVFGLRDQVTERVVSAMAPKLQEAELTRSKRKPTEKLEAYDYYLRSMAKAIAGDRGSNDEGLQLAYKAIELDPEYGAAYGRAAMVYTARKQSRWMERPEQEIAEAVRLSRLAVAFGKEDELALACGGMTLGFVGGEIDAGATFVDQAILLNPNSAFAWTCRGWFYVWEGLHDRALEHFSRAMRLSPKDINLVNAMVGMSFANFFNERWIEAEDWAKKASHLAPTFLSAQRLIAGSLAFQGRIAEAKKVAENIMQLDPTYRLSAVTSVIPLQRQKDIAYYVEGLRLAGIPE